MKKIISTKMMMLKRIRLKALKRLKSFVLCLFALYLIFTVACAPKKPEKKKESKPVAVEKPAANAFEAEVRAFKTADFSYIFTFKRKDGKPMNGEDKRFAKENSHFNTNRFTLSEDETVIFAGSNYKFEEKGLAALRERFEVGDFSKPKKQLGKQPKEPEKKSDK